ncbi:MAG: TonB-dependent receptor [Candidatus Aminicenantes bacterium]|nr:TonB-dependent receptor [Candidatus Aminicenantes bacterium]
MKNRLSILIIVVLLFLSPLMWGQVSSQETGAIRGVITDEEGNPLPGVNIVVSGPSLMGKATDITRSDGSFRILLLPPGVYTLVAELQGFKTYREEGIEVRVGLTVTRNIKMSVATVKEEVTVVGAAPVVDVKSSKTQQIYKADLIQNLPIARNLSSVISLTPGTVDPTNIKGSTAAGNTYQIDGLNANDPTQQQLMIPLDFNLIEEVEVLTGGAPAEVGWTLGGFVNAITKSGGNKFSGTFQAYYTNENLTKPVLPDEELRALGLAKPSAPVYDYEISGGIGGPIIKDRIWFYMDGRYARNVYHSNFIPFTSPYDGTYYDTFDRISYLWAGFAKLTFQLSNNLKLAVMGNVQPSYTNTNASGWNMPFECQPRNDPWGNYAFTGVLTWMANRNTIVEARAGYATVDASFPFVRPELTDVPYMWDGFTGYYFGTGYYAINWIGRPSTQFSSKLTRFVDNFLGGDHELKVGVELQYGGSKWANWKNNTMEWPWYNGSPYYWTAQGYPRDWYGDGYIGFWALGQTKSGSMIEGDFLRYGAFIQDYFTIKNRLTLNIGFRIDGTNGWIPDIHKDRTGSFAYELGELLIKPEIGFNPYDEFTMQGQKDMINWFNISPRIGITYDLFGNGKTALKFNYGIYRESIWGSIIYRNHPLYYKEYFFLWWDDNANGRPDPPSQGDNYQMMWYWSNPVEMLRENWITGVDTNTKAPYDQQFVIGLDHELFKNFKLSLNYMYKSKKNIIDDALYDLDTGRTWYNPNEAPGNQYWVPFTTTVPAIGPYPAQQVTMYFMSNDAPQNWILQIRNIPEAFRKYSALELSFEKRYAHGWQLGGSINYSKTWGNINGGYGDIHGYTSAGNDANWFVNGSGRTYEDRPLVIKLFGSFNVPYGFVLSFNYRFSSGTPWARGVTIVPPVSWAEQNNVNVYNTYYVLLEPSGTRRYNSWNLLDARIEKVFNLKNYGKIGFFVDIFNLLGQHYININQNPGGTWKPVDNNTDQGTYLVSGTYRKITGISNLTRTLRLSVRYTF